MSINLRSRRILGLALAGAALTAAMSVAEPAKAQERVWQMQSTFPSSMPMVGPTGTGFAETVNVLTDGSLIVEFNEPGAIVPALQGFDAVQSGSVDAVWGASAYWVGRIPAAAWFSGAPFGPSAGELLGWLKFGGGQDLWDELYAPFGLKPIACGLMPPEAGGWFNKEVTSLQDVRGLKIRFGGLGAEVMQRVGASTQLIATGDVFPALELGQIDAAELSSPIIDKTVGIQQVAKYYYFPGWHQQSWFIELLVNAEAFGALTVQQQAAVEAACGVAMMQVYADGEAAQGDAIIALREEGVEIREWPQEVLEELAKHWADVVAEKSAEDPAFAKVALSLADFRSRYRVWGDLGYLD